MKKKIHLPGGSFIEVDDRDHEAELEEARERSSQQRLDELVRGIEQGARDPDAFLGEIEQSIDAGFVGKYVDPRREEDPGAEVQAEGFARPQIERELRKRMIENADPELVSEETLRRFLG